jgi:hypothetical protein
MTYKERVLREFEERFTSHPNGVWRDGTIIYPEYQPLTLENIKAFLSQALDGQLAEIREKMRNLKRRVKYVRMLNVERDEIHNAAIDEALSLIPSPSKE